MATKEDRYPKEYKPFPNDKPISSSQGNNNNNNNSSSSSSSSSKHQHQQQQQQHQHQQQQKHSDFRENLKNTISRHMKGFRATNVITYQRFRDKSTWQRPGEFAELVAPDDEDAFTADPKEAWPIMQDMNVDIPIKELTKQHRVVDRNWTVPVSKKKFKQPEPIYPQSTGVKLRKIEDIMNDYSKKAPPQTVTTMAMPALSLPSSASLNATKSLTSNTISIPRVADKSHRPLNLIPDKIQGILQNITDTRRKPAATMPPKSHVNSSSIKTSRKPSTLKSSAVSPQEPKTKKQPTPITKPPYPQSRPRVSSKTIPMEKVTQIDNIPDLIEARQYLVGHDEVEFRSLSSLQEMPKNTQVKKQPQLYFRLYPKPDENAMPKALEQHIASTLERNVSVRQEKATSLSSNEKNKTKTSTQSKNTTSLPLDPSTKSVVVQTNSRKQSQSGQSQAPTRTSSSSTTTNKSKKITNNKEEGRRRESTAHTTTKPDKEAYPSSVSAEFLRSTRIPKRNNSTSKSSYDLELEEGETISPSPSPIRTKSRAHQTDVDDEISNNERPASLPNAKKASTITATAKAKRRDDRDRYRDESNSSSNRRERTNRHRSRSRSRSPVSKSHRSESKNRRPSPPPSRRQTSSESSHRRRTPPARPERENARAEKESTISSIVTAATSTRLEKDTSRPDKELTSTSLTRTERSDKVESSVRETKRKSLHDTGATSESKASVSEPPAKRMAISKTNNKDEKSSANNTSFHTATIEKDTKYTNISNSVSNSSSALSKNVKKPATNVESTPKSVSTPNIATPTSSFTSASTPLTAAAAAAAAASPHMPDKVISATAPNAETPEQYKIFTIMFKQLAHANKRRGDTQKESMIGIIDHFHALCNYMLNFYFVDKVNTNIPFKQASVAWKSLFPFSDSLLSKLQANNLNELYGLCVRLVALIRYYIYSRMESATRPLLTKHLGGLGNQEGGYTDRKCIEMTEGLLREHEKAEKCYNESEKYMTFGKVASQFPGTFKDVCIDGNILAGITLGGEAGVSVAPMFPFTPYSPLHHAAIVSKCILNEYVTKNNMNYSPITKPEEFM